MNHVTGKSLQKFGKRIVNICEFRGDVYMMLSGNTKHITSASDVFTLLCIKPSANSIFKIADFTLPKSTDVICGTGPSPVLLLDNSGEVKVVDLKQGSIVLTVHLQHACVTSDGNYVAGVTNRSVVKLYRLSDKKCIAAYNLSVDVINLEISSDDDYIVVTGSDRKLYAYVIADPHNPEQTLTLKKLPSRNRMTASDLSCVKEDSRYELLHQITKILDSSEFVSEAGSSLDSAYQQQASRVYSFAGDSRTTRDKTQGDLLSKVFGGNDVIAERAASVTSSASSSTLVDSASQLQQPFLPETITGETPIDVRAQSLESVDLPFPLSASTRTDSPTIMPHHSPLPPPEKLMLDLSATSGILHAQQINMTRANKDETKSMKTTVTYKSGEIIRGHKKAALPTADDGAGHRMLEMSGNQPLQRSGNVLEELNPTKPFSLSYKSAVLQQSTQQRLQKIKDQFVEVGFATQTHDPDLSLSLSASGSEAVKSALRSGRSYRGELVASYRRRSRSRSPKSSTTRLSSGTKTSRACVIS